MHRSRRPGPLSLALALAAFAGATCAEAAGAQGSPLSLRVGGGGGVATGGFAAGAVGAELEGGASFGLHFDYRAGLGRRSGPYVGFSQHRLGCAGDGCPGDEAYVHTGWDVGARVGLTSTAVYPWLRLGAVFARVERDFVVVDGARRDVSDLSAGAEGGVGVTIPLPGRLELEPAARYVWLNTRFPGEGVLEVRLVVLDLGLVVRF